MFANDITLGLKTYSLTVQRPTSSIRKNAAAGSSVPNTFNLAHETSKSGQVSSVAYVNTDHSLEAVSCDKLPLKTPVRAQFKLVYNPNAGIVDLETELAAYRDELIAFLQDATSWSRFLNQES